MSTPDAALIDAVLSGRRDAFAPLVERYHGGAYALVWSIVRDFAAADDVTQEAFLAAYTELSELRDREAFPAWLRQIAVNRARAWLRRRRGKETTSDLDRVAAAERGGPTGLSGEITAILESLPGKKREVAMLCYVDELSRKDAARLLGVSEGTLRKRLHDAKRLLQRRIVEAAERNLEQHLLPRGFLNRCICACKRAGARKPPTKMERKPPMKTEPKDTGTKTEPKDTGKKDCGCGCSGPGPDRSTGKDEDGRKTDPRTDPPVNARD